MPICLKCKNKFPNRYTLSGKIRNLQNRKFCLKCSPFKSHNTKDIRIHPKTIGDNKTCPKCLKIFSNSSENFYYKNSSHTSLGSYCKKCSNQETIRRQRNWKIKCIEHKGGKCLLCGYYKHLEALDFHHLDPSKKEISLSQARMASFEKIKTELNKCILVCSNCHREIHADKHPQYLIVKEHSNLVASEGI